MYSMSMQKIKRLSSPQFFSIYSRVPRLCVEVVIKNGKGVLLSKRDIPPAKGWWHIPGGTVLLGETLAQAVRRVAFRELGVRVVTGKMLGVIEYSRAHAVGQSIGIAFAARVVSGKFRANAEASEIRFFQKLPVRIVSEQRTFLKKVFGLV